MKKLKDSMVRPTLQDCKEFYRNVEVLDDVILAQLWDKIPVDCFTEHVTAVLYILRESLEEAVDYASTLWREIEMKEDEQADFEEAESDEYYRF